MSITCPQCGMTSHHPTDQADGYCGNCHDWTSPPPAQSIPCLDCGLAFRTERDYALHILRGTHARARCHHHGGA